MAYKLTFVSKSGPSVPATLVADYTVSDFGIKGMVLVGGAIWRGKKGDNYASMPSRNGGGKFFDLLRYESDPLDAQVFKSDVLSAYEDALANGQVEQADQA